jgi:hypothetical protein
MTNAIKLHRIQLSLARGAGHPDVDAADGYELRVPLSAAGRIDVGAWRRARNACSVYRIRDRQVVQRGILAHHPGGRGGATWSFDYSGGTPAADETEEGFRLADRAFIVGEYVSIRDEDDGALKTYRVTSVGPA